MITAAFRNRLFSHNLNMQQEQRYDLVEYGEGGFPIILFHLAWYTTDEQVVCFSSKLAVFFDFDIISTTAVLPTDRDYLTTQ